MFAATVASSFTAAPLSAHRSAATRGRRPFAWRSRAALRAVLGLPLALSLALALALSLALSPTAGQAQKADTTAHKGTAGKASKMSAPSKSTPDTTDSTAAPDSTAPVVTPQSICISCGPTDNPPTISISPAGGTFSTSTVTVTIDWCDDFNLDGTTRHITLNGVDVTSQFSYFTPSPKPCTVAARSVGTVTLTRIGANSLSAQIADFTQQLTTDGATYTYTPPPSVSVTPDGATAPSGAAGSHSATFTVNNTGGTSATYNLSAGCTALLTCSSGTSVGPIAPGGSAPVSVTYTVVSINGSSGTVALHATDNAHSGVVDSGYVVVPPGPAYLSVATTATNNDNQNLGLCDASCFTATYAQSTVPYISLNTPRGVTVAYHGDRMAVRPFIATDVSLRSGAPALQQYWLQAQVNWGGGWTNVTFLNGEQTLHFAAPSTVSRSVRLAGQFDASSQATGAYPLQIIVTAQYATYTETFVDNSQHLLVVNERASPVAQGWTIAGLQHLYLQGDGAALITDGTGSAAYFAHCGGGCFTTPAGDFSRLTVSGSGAGTVYTRVYPDSSRVLFNNIGLATTQIARLPDTTRYTYDGSGRLIGISDPIRSAKSTCFDCGPGGTTITITQPFLTLSYGANGLSSITEQATNTGGVGRVTQFTVGADLTLQAIQDPDGLSTQFRYDSQHRLLSVIDRRGDTASYVYQSDNSWKLAAQISPSVPTDIGGGNTSMQHPTVTLTPWQVASVPTGSTSSTPAVPVFTDSVRGVVTDPGGHTTRFTVDRWGQPMRITGPFGLITEITRTGIFATKIDAPTGAEAVASYNASGLLTMSAPPGQGETIIQYGAYARPIQITSPGQPAQTFTPGKYGTDSLATVAGSDPTHFYVDSLGRDTMVVDPVGHTTRFHYESTFGNLDSTLAEGNRWAKTVFDRFGRDSLHFANHLPADTTTYDLLNRVVRQASPGLGATTMTYDPLYQTRLKDPKGSVYRITVDALGRVMRRYDPADTVNRFLSYRYNLDGLVSSWTDRRGNRVDFAYDSLHRELAKTGTGVVVDSFSYNPTGTVVVGWNGASRDSIYADNTGWVDSVVTWLQPANKRFRRYYHHVFGTTQLDSIGLATTSGIQLANRYYTWDPTTALLDGMSTGTPTGNLAQITRTPELLDSTIVWPGAVTEFLAHTMRHELLSTTFSVPALNSLSRQYSYADSLGHLTAINRNNGGDGEIRRFAYTPSGELSSAEVDSLLTITDCPPPPDHQLLNDGYTCNTFSGMARLHVLGFMYDSAANRTQARDSVTGASTLGSYTTGNRLNTWGAATYTYDRDGNDSTKTVGGQTTTYSWTADGRLNSVTVGNTILLYVYNAFGQLVQRWRSVNRGAPVLERQFLWDQGQLMAELDGTGTHRIAEYAYWPGADQPYALITGATAITATRYFQQDAAGNVIGIFTSSAPAQSLVYQPFGVVDSAYSGLTALADTSRLRWKGLLWEGDSTRLYYMRNRWYDPQSGRFLSEDPIGQAGGLNIYAFGGQDPINFADPIGNCPAQVTTSINGHVLNVENIEIAPGASLHGSTCNCDNQWESGGGGESCGSSGGLAGGSGNAGTPGLVKSIIAKVCAALPDGRVIGARAGIGGIASGQGATEAVLNYNSGQISEFGAAGLQVGWNGAVSGSAYSGLIWGLKDDNSNYSGGFTEVSAELGVGLFFAGSSGGLTSHLNQMRPNGNVSVLGVSMGAGLVGGLTAGVSVMNYSNPLNVGAILDLSGGDYTMFYLKQLCK